GSTSRRPRASTSVDSHTGPTTSTVVSRPRRGCTWTMSCSAPYRAGRSRSFIPASTMTSVRPAATFRYSTRVSSTPALPPRARPALADGVGPGPRRRRAPGAGPGAGGGRRLAGVADAQPPSDVEPLQRQAARAQLAVEPGHLPQRPRQGRQLGELAPDVTV